LVAFLPVTGADQIAWAPLAPGDPYAPAYYDANWQPHYVGGGPVFPERVTNIGALTVVSVDDFGRRIDRRNIARFDPRAFDGVRPLGDPLSHAMLRQASLTRAIERRGFVLPPGLGKRLNDRQVYTSARPAAPPFRDDFARRLRVEAVPEKQKREKLKFNDERQQTAARSNGDGRGHVESGRPPREARRAERDARREEKAQERAARGRDSQPRQLGPDRPVAERVSGRAEERARGERGGPPRQAQDDDGRARQQQRAIMQQQAEGRRQAEAQQRAAQRAQQQEQMRGRPSQQRGRAERQQQQPQAQPRQAPPGQARRQQPQARQQGPARAERPAQQSTRPQGPGNGGGNKGNAGGKGKGRGPGGRGGQ
jgi:hypothetical protein